MDQLNLNYQKEKVVNDDREEEMISSVCLVNYSTISISEGVLCMGLPEYIG